MNAHDASTKNSHGWQLVLRISFSGEDYEAVKAAALVQGLTPSAFVRMAALKEVPPSVRWSRGWVAREREH
jgi:hypothetical protein